MPLVRAPGAEGRAVRDEASRSSPVSASELRIAVVACPHISNLDEFQPLRDAGSLGGVRLVWARSPHDLEGADWIVLPGSKQTQADLAWLREQHLDVAVWRHAAAGVPCWACAADCRCSVHALFGADHEVRTLDAVFDGLADFIDAHFEPGFLINLLKTP